MRAKEFLNEINMSPQGLREQAKKINATVGIEFEMIVPGAYNQNEEAEDIPVNSIQQILQFFEEGMSDRESNKVMNAIQQIMLETALEEWDRQQVSLMAKWVSDNISDVEVAELLEDDPDNITQSDYVKFARHQIDIDSDYVNEARAEYIDDQVEFSMDLSAIRIYNMSDVKYVLQRNGHVSEAIQLIWPTAVSQDGNIDDLVYEFSQAVGFEANDAINTGYDSSGPEYNITTDSSIEADDDDTGLEFVSPPLPLNTMIEQLHQVKAWASDNGCYTNDSTGLHINVSIPNFNQETYDPVKLVVLLGDQHVLEKFGRETSSYTTSSLKMITRNRNITTTIESLMQKLRTNIGKIASATLDWSQREKYQSVHLKGSYIEFRAAGGDWLDENFDKIEDTILRYVVALDAACNPTKFDKEYRKKLYKIFDTTSNPVMSKVAQYISGEITSADWKNLIKSRNANGGTQ